MTDSNDEAADPVLFALDELIAAARDNWDNWQRVIARADKARAARLAGVRWSDMQLGDDGPTVVDAMSENQERLTVAAAHFRRVLARALAEEGWSYAEIARAFHVSRQRVGNLLRPDLAGQAKSAAGGLST